MDSLLGPALGFSYFTVVQFLELVFSWLALYGPDTHSVAMVGGPCMDQAPVYHQDTALCKLRRFGVCLYCDPDSPNMPREFTRSMLSAISAVVLKTFLSHIVSFTGILAVFYVIVPLCCKKKVMTSNCLYYFFETDSL